MYAYAYIYIYFKRAEEWLDYVFNIDNALTTNNIGVAEWLITNNFRITCTRRSIITVSANGYIDVLNWMDKNGLIIKYYGFGPRK